MAEYEKMITFFHKEEIPAVSDIMLGLPGQTFETCKKDLQFCFDHKVLAMIFATSVMPNAPMADEEYRRKFQITSATTGSSSRPTASRATSTPRCSTSAWPTSCS